MRSLLDRGETLSVYPLWTSGDMRALWALVTLMSNLQKGNRSLCTNLHLTYEEGGWIEFSTTKYHQRATVSYHPSEHVPMGNWMASIQPLSYSSCFNSNSIGHSLQPLLLQSYQFLGFLFTIALGIVSSWNFVDDCSKFIIQTSISSLSRAQGIDVDTINRRTAINRTRPIRQTFSRTWLSVFVFSPFSLLYNNYCVISKRANSNVWFSFNE